MSKPVSHDDEPPGPVLPATAGADVPTDDEPDVPVEEQPPGPGQTRSEMFAPSPGGEPGETNR